jgi:hypothetical protein
MTGNNEVLLTPIQESSIEKALQLLECSCLLTHKDLCNAGIVFPLKTGVEIFGLANYYIDFVLFFIALGQIHTIIDYLCYAFKNDLRRGMCINILTELLILWV